MARAQPRREHLLDVAFSLFNIHGYHNTGIEMIRQQSRVSKTTMYKYFDSKEDLVLEVLRRRHSAVLELIDSYLQKSQKQHPEYVPHKHIEAIFEATKQWILDQEFAGCNFINASAEYGQVDDPIHNYAASHKQAVRDRVQELLSHMPQKKASTLAKQIVMLLDGAIVTAHVSMDKSAIDTALLIAKKLLDSELG